MLAHKDGLSHLVLVMAWYINWIADKLLLGFYIWTIKQCWSRWYTELNRALLVENSGGL